MGSYSQKRATEKSTTQLADQKKEDDQKKRQLENRLFREAANKEQHVAVWTGNNSKKLWRLSQIEADLKKFCQQAGLSFSAKNTTIDSPEVKKYIERYTCQPATIV